MKNKQMEMFHLLNQQLPSPGTRRFFLTPLHHRSFLIHVSSGGHQVLSFIREALMSHLKQVKPSETLSSSVGPARRCNQIITERTLHVE